MSVGKGLASSIKARGLSREKQAVRVVIEPSRGWVSLKLRELWDYCDLLYFLPWCLRGSFVISCPQ